MAITLSSGFKMPVVGLGVWRMEGNEIRDLVINALNLGYRHFDCAACSTNYLCRCKMHCRVNAALMQLWNSDHGHVVEACKDSLKKLRLDHLDLYLVHFPVATKHTGVGTTGSALDEDGVLEIDTTISLETTWHAVEELVSMGLVALELVTMTSKLERLKENFQVFDFELTKEDMDLIAKVDRKHRTNQPAKFWGVDLFA